MQAKRQLVICLLLAAAACAGCGEQTAEPPIRPVRAMKLGDVSGLETRWFPGRAKATEEVNLSFRVAGELIALPIDVGDVVKEGDVLAKLDPSDFQAALERAKARLAQAVAELDAMQIARPEEIRRLESEVKEAEAVLALAETDYGRALRMQKEDPGSIAQRDVDRRLAARDRSTAVLDQTKESLIIAQKGARKEDVAAKEAEIRSLDAEVAVARNNLDYTQLRAKFDGTIVAKYVENYQTVVAQQAVCRLLDSSRIEIVVDIPESHISLAPYVTDVICIFDAFPDTKIEGVEIKEVGIEASEVTRTYPVTCIMDQPDPSTGVKILPGMAGRLNGKAKLPDQAEEQGFDVPESAVFSGDGGREHVWVIDETMVVRAQAVTPISLTATGMRVTGLEAGQRIATAGVDYLKEGRKISILEDSGAQAQ
ncbi:MAG: efflux RND transporter periplasmic adaptor subunit [Planctomycetota bacterium]|jgi:RND family efflux transporter MFP subunit